MPFEIPESYRAYCTDVAVRTAVDHILSSSDRRSGLALPADIDWKDLPAFHRALLLAHQVRCEYPVLLIRLWNAVWQPALDERDVGRNLERGPFPLPRSGTGRHSIRTQSGIKVGLHAGSTSSAQISGSRQESRTMLDE